MKSVVKFLSILLALCMLSGLFAGCAGKEAAKEGDETQMTQAGSAAGTTAESTPAEGSKQVTLRFGWWGGDERHKGTLDTINLYMSKNPGIKIEAEYGGYDDYYKKLLTQLAGGTAPDIMQLDQPWLFDLNKQGKMFVDLNTIKDIVKIDGFDQQFLKDFCIIDGELQGLPTGINGQITMYNKTLLEKSGITVKQDWDWDDLLNMGKQLHAADSNYYLLNGDFRNIDYNLRRYFKQKTGKAWINEDYTLGFTRDELVDTFHFLLKMLDNYVYMPFSEIAPYDSEADKNPRWAKGQIGAMLDDLSGFDSLQSTTQGDLEVMPIPVAKDSKTPAGIVRPSQLLGINTKSADANEAAKFINYFFTDKDAILTLGTLRGVPPTDEARTILTENNKLDRKYIDGVNAALKTRGAPENALEVNEEIVQITLDVIQKVGFKKATPEQGTDELIKRYTEKLNELKNQ
jgi:oligogalacturonide transport system substrate-binding protein